jgi:hypothetical protein
MRTSGVASDRSMTWVVFVVAFGFLVILAGGPMELLRIIQKAIEAIMGLILQLVQQF